MNVHLKKQPIAVLEVCIEFPVPKPKEINQFFLHKNYVFFSHDSV